MKPVTMAFVLGMILVALNSCKLESHAEGGPVPTRGPVQALSGQTGLFGIYLAASTNCVEVGQVVTFSVRIVNEASQPITITEPLEITIQQEIFNRDVPDLIHRWSESNQYVQTNQLVLASGEERMYEWKWQTDAIFAQQRVDKNNIEVTSSISFVTPKGDQRSAGPKIGIGINALQWGMGAVRCTDMKQ